MGKIVRRNMEGDQTLAEWSPGDTGSVEAAEKILTDEREAGFHAVQYNEGEQPKPVMEFDPGADTIVITTAMGGG